MFPFLDLPEDVCHQLGSFLDLKTLSRIKRVHPLTNQHYSVFDFHPTEYICHTDKWFRGSKDYRIIAHNCWSNLKAITFTGKKQQILMLPCESKHPMKVNINEHHFHQLKYFKNVEEVTVVSTKLATSDNTKEFLLHLIKITDQLIYIKAKCIRFKFSTRLGAEMVFEWLFLYKLYHMLSPNVHVQVLVVEQVGNSFYAYRETLLNAFPNLLGLHSKGISYTRKDVYSDFDVAFKIRVETVVTMPARRLEQIYSGEAQLQPPAIQYQRVIARSHEGRCNTCGKLSIWLDDQDDTFPCLDCYLIEEAEEDNQEEEQDDDEEEEKDTSGSEYNPEDEEEEDTCPECREISIGSVVCIDCINRRESRRRRSTRRRG